jgi:phosphoglycerate dehydrogenase-like enzyme
MALKPKMLLNLSDAGPYLDGLSRAGVADRFDIAISKSDEQPAAADLEQADILISFGERPGTLARMPKLKWIQSMSVGVDQWLSRADLSPDVIVTAARGTHRVQMPENILGAIFHVSKKYHQIALAQTESKWVRSMSVPLAGKTLGILGLGAVGQELARKAAALELRVIGTRRTSGDVPHVDRVYAPEQIDDVLAASDFAVLLLPVTKDTENLINKARLAHMKKDAWLLNFGRGALIVDDDLIAAVKSKAIAGAILDVFRTEPLPADHPFWQTPGIAVLPHIGGGHPTRDLMVAELFTENAQRYLAGKPLKEIVDRERGY